MRRLWKNFKIHSLLYESSDVASFHPLKEGEFPVGKENIQISNTHFSARASDEMTKIDWVYEERRFIWMSTGGEREKLPSQTSEYSYNWISFRFSSEVSAWELSEVSAWVSPTSALDFSRFTSEFERESKNFYMKKKSWEKEKNRKNSQLLSSTMTLNGI